MADTRPVKKMLVLLGTRPEAIKMCPVIAALQGEAGFLTVVCSTGQHRAMLDQVLTLFAVKPDIDLQLMRPDQTLAGLHSRAMAELDEVLAEQAPDCVLVQGDTSTAMVGALAAFYRQIPVGHVEAGLRTDDIYHPFPEEVNRRIIGCLAALHFAPTRRAADALLREGAKPANVFLTGNTVVDALLWVKERLSPALREKYQRPGQRLVLVTAHRRESFGEPFRDLCRAFLELLRRNPDLWILYPVHLNPHVQRVVQELLSGHERIQLVDPLPYDELVSAMNASTLILTDSGGIQEEAPSLGKPSLVLREKTERPEAVEAGTSILVGRDPARIVGEAERLLNDPAYYQDVARKENPFGDGHAAERILAALRERFLG